MRFSIHAAMVRSKHNDRTTGRMKESCPRECPASIAERFMELCVHLLFQHQGIRQRFDPQGHRSSALFLEEGTLAGALSYRRRQKGVPNLYGIQCVLPLLHRCRSIHFSDYCVKHRSALLNEPKELFKCVKFTKYGCIHKLSLFNVWDKDGHRQKTPLVFSSAVSTRISGDEDCWRKASSSR